MKKTIFPTHFILLEEPLSDVEIDTSVALSALSSRWNETDAPPEAAEYVAPEKDADSEQLLLLPHFCAPAEHGISPCSNTPLVKRRNERRFDSVS